MQNASANRKIIVLILAMILLIYGVQNVSYGQVAPTVEVGEDDTEVGEDDTKYKHDGFYLRLTTGVGSTTSIEETEVGEFSFSGLSGNTTLGIGYAVVENLIINLDIFASTVTDPTVEIDGRDVGEVDAEVRITNIGVGATYYIMPINVYLASSIALAEGSVKSGRVAIETDTGYGINVAIGKEWWVSDNWGIGVAGQLFHTVLPNEDLITGEVFDLKTTSLAILFSATFN